MSRLYYNGRAGTVVDPIGNFGEKTARVALYHRPRNHPRTQWEGEQGRFVMAGGVA
jgi:hypothetical protein